MGVIIQSENKHLYRISELPSPLSCYGPVSPSKSSQFSVAA